jgi:hypothetical protein
MMVGAALSQLSSSIKTSTSLRFFKSTGCNEAKGHSMLFFIEFSLHLFGGGRQFRGAA